MITKFFDKTQLKESFDKDEIKSFVRFAYDAFLRDNVDTLPTAEDIVKGILKEHSELVADYDNLLKEVKRELKDKGYAFNKSLNESIEEEKEYEELTLQINKLVQERNGLLDEIKEFREKELDPLKQEWRAYPYNSDEYQRLYKEWNEKRDILKPKQDRSSELNREINTLQKRQTELYNELKAPSNVNAYEEMKKLVDKMSIDLKDYISEGKLNTKGITNHGYYYVTADFKGLPVEVEYDDFDTEEDEDDYGHIHSRWVYSKDMSDEAWERNEEVNDKLEPYFESLGLEKGEPGYYKIPNTDWEIGTEIYEANGLGDEPEVTHTYYSPATWGYYGGSPEEFDMEWEPEYFDTEIRIDIRKKL